MSSFNYGAVTGKSSPTIKFMKTFGMIKLLVWMILIKTENYSYTILFVYWK